MERKSHTTASFSIEKSHCSESALLGIQCKKEMWLLFYEKNAGTFRLVLCSILMKNYFRMPSVVFGKRIFLIILNDELLLVFSKHHVHTNITTTGII